MRKVFLICKTHLLTAYRVSITVLDNREIVNKDSLCPHLASILLYKEAWFNTGRSDFPGKIRQGYTVVSHIN